MARAGSPLNVEASVGRSPRSRRHRVRTVPRTGEAARPSSTELRARDVDPEGGEAGSDQLREAFLDELARVAWAQDAVCLELLARGGIPGRFRQPPDVEVD